MMESQESNQGNTYQIKVKETLNPGSANWFGDITITHQEDGATLLSGKFADQPALRGFLDQLWNLNFTILYLERIDNEHPK
jgi:hypothetical protein